MNKCQKTEQANLVKYWSNTIKRFKTHRTFKNRFLDTWNNKQHDTQHTRHTRHTHDTHTTHTTHTRHTTHTTHTTHTPYWVLPLSVRAALLSQAASRPSAESAAASVWHHPGAPVAAGSSPRSARKRDEMEWRWNSGEDWRGKGEKGKMHWWQALRANVKAWPSCQSPAETPDTHGDELDSSHLSVERVFAGQLVLQFVFYVVERRRLPLGTQVPANRANRQTGGAVSGACFSEAGTQSSWARRRSTNLRSNVVILSSMSSLWQSACKS